MFVVKNNAINYLQKGLITVYNGSFITIPPPQENEIIHIPGTVSNQELLINNWKIINSIANTTTNRSVYYENNGQIISYPITMSDSCDVILLSANGPNNLGMKRGMCQMVTGDSNITSSIDSINGSRVRLIRIQLSDEMITFLSKKSYKFIISAQLSLIDTVGTNLRSTNIGPAFITSSGAYNNVYGITSKIFNEKESNVFIITFVTFEPIPSNIRYFAFVCYGIIYTDSVPSKKNSFVLTAITLG